MLVLVLGLAACGGKAAFDVKGVVSELKYSGLVLSNGAAELAVPANATTFNFANTIEYGDLYDVKVKAQPLHQRCEVINGADTAGRLASINIIVACALNPFGLGGTVSGLTADGLVIVNGSNGTVTLNKDATVYQFANPVLYGSSYGVTVLTQPPGLTCSVANGIGEMGDVDVSNANVSCVPN